MVRGEQINTLFLFYRIYRLGTKVISTDQPVEYALASWSVGKLLKGEYLEIEDFVRIAPIGGVGVLFRLGNKEFYEENIALADPSLFNIFTVKFIYGSPDPCLAEPGDLVLTKSLTRKLTYAIQWFCFNDKPLGNLPRCGFF